MPSCKWIHQRSGLPFRSDNPENVKQKSTNQNEKLQKKAGKRDVIDNVRMGAGPVKILNRKNMKIKICDIKIERVRYKRWLWTLTEESRTKQRKQFLGVNFLCIRYIWLIGTRCGDPMDRKLASSVKWGQGLRKYFFTIRGQGHCLNMISSQFNKFVWDRWQDLVVKGKTSTPSTYPPHQTQSNGAGEILQREERYVQPRKACPWKGHG